MLAFDLAWVLARPNFLKYLPDRLNTNAKGVDPVNAAISQLYVS